ncbi:hypothetical protein K0017_05030 [Staphylococcus massiliensis]|nr:hypothetical protein [Staphylococcus massiliensis]MCG3401683.1 hypothetical protein [Staphylococcus massiliensis]
MENEIIRHERKFFMVEKDSENIEQVLQRYYGGSGFHKYKMHTVLTIKKV